MESRTSNWHVNKSISLSHIAATISLIVTVLFAYSTLEKRVAILEVEIEAAKASDMKLEKDYRESAAEIKATLLRIEAKIDSKQDKQ